MRHLLFVFAAVALAACGSAVDKPAAATPVVYGESVVLSAPDASRTTNVVEALRNRRSSRDYSAEALSLEELSGVMWAAAGQNREDGHLTAPSALALYPIRVYAFFADGVYLYDSASHTLNRVADGDCRRLTGMQPFVETAPLNLVYVADTGVYDGRNIPAEHVRYLCGQDAAGYAANVSLYNAAAGLKSVVRGSFDADALLTLLNLDPQTHFVALAQSVGK